MERPALLIRKKKNDELIHRVPLNQTDASYVEKVMGGLLKKLHEDYYIDDTEVDAFNEAKTTVGELEEKGD